MIVHPSARRRVSMRILRVCRSDSFNDAFPTHSEPAWHVRSFSRTGSSSECPVLSLNDLNKLASAVSTVRWRRGLWEADLNSQPSSMPEQVSSWASFTLAHHPAFARVPQVCPRSTETPGAALPLSKEDERRGPGAWRRVLWRAFLGRELSSPGGSSTTSASDESATRFAQPTNA